MLKVLELFAGIGACSKALERLGIEHEIVDAVEIDKYAIASFNAIHNTNFKPQDITKWDKDIQVDLIMHGSPCQDFSLAGLQAGGDEGSGTRSSLMYESIRIINKLKPKYVIWENVKNLLSKKHIHNFNAYLETMEQLGYANYYQVLNAKDYGIPQNRERVFTVSIRHDILIEKWTANNCFEFPPQQELKLKLKDMLEDEVDEKYYLSDEKINSISHWKAYQKPFEKVQGNNSICPTLTARGAGEEHSGMITYCDKLSNTTNLQEECLSIKNATNGNNHGVVVNKKTELCNYLIENNKVKENDVIRHSYSTSRLNEWQTRNIEKSNEAPTLDTRCDCLGVVVNASKEPKVEVIGNYSPSNHEASRIVSIEGLVPTVKENHGTVTGIVVEKDTENYIEWKEKGKMDIDCRAFKEDKMSGSIMTTPKNKVLQNNLRIRKLTPKECWRLMGFDDEDYEKASKVNTNSQLYKQAGNSIVVNVLEEILRNLLLGGKYDRKS